MRKEITNLGLAAYLSGLGYNLVEVKPNGRRAAFVFESKFDIEADSMAFFNKQGKVEPLSFWESMKNLKALAER